MQFKKIENNDNKLKMGVEEYMIEILYGMRHQGSISGQG